MLFQQLKYRIIIIVLTCLSFPFVLQAQYLPNKKARHYQDLSIIHFRQGDTTNAREFAMKATEEDDQFAMPWVMIGNIDELQNKKPSAIRSYREAMRRDSIHEFKHIYYALAELEIKLKDFDAAITDISKYLSLGVADEQEQKEAEQLLSTAEFRKKAYQNPVAFKPYNLGKGVNTPEDEYVNSLSTDEKSMYLTIKTKMAVDENGLPIFIENIYKSQLDRLNWSNRELIMFGGQALDGAGGASVSPNNRYLFFTSCNRSDSKGSCDLYYSKFIDGKLSDVKNLGSVVNSASWDSQPCFSSDGKSLFFASRRPGGYGGSDIWISVLDEQGRFQVPTNAGNVINTAEDEMAPLIHQDAKTLYYSSNGHIGMGGFDLFMSRKLGNNTWSIAKNLGHPINTERDEINLIVSPDGQSAYLSSDQPDGFGGFDIYKFNMDETIKPNPVTYIEGLVFDSETGEKLSANILLSLNETNEVLTTSQSDVKTGTFLVVLPMNQSISMNVSKPGYLFYSEHFNTNIEDCKVDPVQIQIPLHKIKSGETLILNNIYFETNQYELMESSTPELHKLMKLLNENPEIKIEISGHTDNVGTMKYNKELSERRAKAVFDYLISNGIDKTRVYFKGYGFSKPIDSNEKESGRYKNRRTEIRIL